MVCFVCRMRLKTRLVSQKQPIIAWLENIQKFNKQKQNAYHLIRWCDVYFHFAITREIHAVQYMRNGFAFIRTCAIIANGFSVVVARCMCMH